jgi:type IV secretory pathway VirB10-like protein
LTNEERPIPDTERHLPEGHVPQKRKNVVILGAVGGILVLLILATLGGSKQPPLVGSQQQNQAGQISPQQVHALQQSIVDDTQRINEQRKQIIDKQKALDAAATNQDLAARLQQAGSVPPPGAMGSAPAISYPDSQYGANNVAATAPVIDKKELARRALYSTMIVADFRKVSATPADVPQPTPAAKQDGPDTDTKPTPQADPETPRSPLDYDPSWPTVYLPEGTIIEAETVNKLQGETSTPLKCQLTTAVYEPGTRKMVLPQGAFALGEASAVSYQNQQLLTVAFHRFYVPANPAIGARAYTIPLDKQTPGLSQEGMGGLKDKVNNHIPALLLTAGALGALAGLEQIGNSVSGFGYSPGMQFRNGLTQGMTQSATEILNRGLNRLPTITIRTGTRTKIYLRDDTRIPLYGGGAS